MNQKFKIILILTLVWTSFCASPVKAESECMESLRALTDFKTEALEKEVEIAGKTVNYYEVKLPKNTQEIDADKISWKAYHRDAFAEVFFKIIRPSVTNEWKLQKFNLSDILKSSDRHELILGLDVNHTYLVLHDKRTGLYTRADGGGNSAFFVRTKTETVTSGLFIRFPSLTNEEADIIRSSFSDRKTFTTCTHAACSSLAKIGVYFGGKDDIPQTTAEALMAVLKGGLKQDETPLKIEIFTTSTKSFQQQIDQAIKVSKINGSIRQKDIKGYLAVIYYGGKTVLKWIFIDLPKKVLESITYVAPPHTAYYPV